MFYTCSEKYILQNKKVVLRLESGLLASKVQSKYKYYCKVVMTNTNKNIHVYLKEMLKELELTYKLAPTQLTPEQILDLQNDFFRIINVD